LLNYRSKNNLLNHQNNFVGTLNIISNAAKNVDILATSLSVPHNYFDSSTKLFLYKIIYIYIYIYVYIKFLMLIRSSREKFRFNPHLLLP